MIFKKIKKKKEAIDAGLNPTLYHLPEYKLPKN